MGASSLRNKFKKAGIKIDVMHCSLEEIPKDIQLVVTHKDLAARARAKAPNAELVTIENFVGAPEYDQLVEKLK
jgi:PTS system mannitol-specific IIC component